MPVNQGRYMEESVRSILGQSLADLELVVVTDGLGADDVARLREWACRDARIRVHERSEPMDQIAAANEAVRLSRAPLVARMDADDVAHPDRLRRQVEVFQNEPDAVLVGTVCDGIGPSGRRTRPPDRAPLRRPDAFAPFPHGSAMYRRDAFDRTGGYRQACSGWSELDLFLRMAAHGRAFVLPGVLYHYRYHEDSLTMRRPRPDLERALAQKQRCVAAYRAGRPYEQLLDAAPGSANGWATEAYVINAAHALWSGGRPGSWPVWRHPSGRALLYGAWGAASPTTLRLAFRGWIRMRDRLARRHSGDGPYEWHFGS